MRVSGNFKSKTPIINNESTSDQVKINILYIKAYLSFKDKRFSAFQWKTIDIAE